MRRLVALAFHAERLHEATTWAQMARVVRRIDHCGAGATVFIYPLPAHLAGCDLTERVRTLAALGQEIGQHTHFYAGTRIGKAEKADDFSDQNVQHCIERDLRLIEQAGARSHGFISGGWVVTPKVVDTLADLGFSYDCSARLPTRGRHAGSAFHEWLTAPRVDERGARHLIRLPTTCSLGEWFRWGWRISAEGAERFQIVYLHDYDLNRRRIRWLLAAFLRLNHNRLVRVGALLGRVATGGNAGRTR